jgi:predicted helicase
MLVAFNEEQRRWRHAGRPKKIDAFLRKDLKTIKWIRRSKKAIAQAGELRKEDICIRQSLYRPFTKKFHNLTAPFNEDVYSQKKYFPEKSAEAENRMMLVTTHSQVSFTMQATNLIPWVIDQYRVSTDARSEIVNDPNRAEDERYILRLIGQVITVSLETMTVVGALPSLNFPD